MPGPYMGGVIAYERVAMANAPLIRPSATFSQGKRLYIKKKRGIAAPPRYDGYGEYHALARAVPRAAQAVSASPSGAPLAMTGSTTMRAPAASASSAQVRIHSPSPQP